MNKTRKFHGALAKFEKYFIVVFTLFCLVYLSGILDRVGLYIFATTYDALVMAFIMLLAFGKFPAYKNAPLDRIPWYDLVLIALSLAGTLNIAISSPDIAAQTRQMNSIDLILGLITIVLLLEAVRRTVGPILAALGALFFLYPLLADKAPGFLERPAWGIKHIVEVQYFVPNGIFSSTLHLVATLILAFIIFGNFLTVSGSSKTFINLAESLAGRFRGGPAKVSVLGSCLFGMVNGSTLANIATVGTTTIPLMKKIGYRPVFAGAIEAVASNGGPLTPPVMGATVFLMMAFLNMEYAQLIIIAAIPAFIYYFGLILMVDQEAAKRDLKGLPKNEIPPLKRSLLESWFFIIPFAVIIIMLVGLRLSPAISAIGGIIAVVIASYFTKKTRSGGSGKWIEALGDTGQGLPQVGIAVAVAGILVGAFQLTGVGLVLAQELVNLAGGNLILLVMFTWVACIILGMGLTVVAVYLLAAILLVPALTMVGVNPLAAHFFVIWAAQAALLTPPVCNASFLAGAIAEAPLMATGWQACRLGIVVYLVPVFWVFDPALLLVGSPAHIAIVIVCTIIGAYFLTGGISGWLLARTSLAERILCGIAGIGLMFPETYSSIVGGILAAIVLIIQVYKMRSARKAVPPLSSTQASS